MDPMTPGRASRFLLLVGFQLLFLATGAYSVTPQAQSPVRHSSSSSHTRPIKRTWRTGPASMPLETEIVPPHPSSVPPPAKARVLSIQKEQKAKSEEKTGASAAPTLTATRESTTSSKPEVRTIDESRSPDYVDPEKRALDELSQLRANPQARQAFYDNLRHTVDRVRAGEENKNANNLPTR
jgi:hypothetical protein